MKIPFIKVKQREEIFFVTKLKASVLKEHIDFHFRDPYLRYQTRKESENTESYITKIKKLGLKLKSTDEGIQRRLQIERIKDIKNYVELNSSNFFPNSVILSLDAAKIPNFDNQYLEADKNNLGYFELPESIKFTVIDGQHRLAGLFLSDENTIKDFELVAILLFNISMPTAAKLFLDINGKQKPVNRSLIYDLYGEINATELDEIKKFHTIAQKFYVDKKSPLFRQIKMLGIGKGAISQSFFIDYVSDAAADAGIIDEPLQKIYDNLFYYFKAFQKTFPKDWPVPLEFKDYEESGAYADYVLKERKSQLVKTNGFGAIVTLFPYVYRMSDKSFKSYLEIVSRLKRNMDWVQADTIGTGKKLQKILLEKMKEILNISD